MKINVTTYIDNEKLLLKKMKVIYWKSEENYILKYQDKKKQ